MIVFCKNPWGLSWTRSEGGECGVDSMQSQALPILSTSYNLPQFFSGLVGTLPEPVARAGRIFLLQPAALGLGKEKLLRFVSHALNGSVSGTF